MDGSVHRQLHRKQIHAWQAVQKSVVVWWLIQQRPELVRGSPGSPVFSGESDELMEAGEDGGVGGCSARGPGGRGRAPDARQPGDHGREDIIRPSPRRLRWRVGGVRPVGGGPS